jgi:hypothetical protein
VGRTLRRLREQGLWRVRRRCDGPRIEVRELDLVRNEIFRIFEINLDIWHERRAVIVSRGTNLELDDDALSL